MSKNQKEIGSRIKYSVALISFISFFILLLISLSFAKKTIAGTITELTYHCKPTYDPYSESYVPKCQNGLTGIFCRAVEINNQGKLTCSDGGIPGAYYPFVDCKASWPSVGDDGRYSCFGKDEMTIVSSAVSNDYIAFPIRWIVNDTEKGTSELYGDCEFVTWGTSGQFVMSDPDGRVEGVVSGGSARIPLGYVTFRDGTIMSGSFYNLAEIIHAGDQSDMHSLTIDKIVVGKCASESAGAPGMLWSPEGIAYCEGKYFTPTAEISIPKECIVTIPINPLLCSKDTKAPVTNAKAVDSNRLPYEFGRPSAADHIKVELSCTDLDPECPMSGCDNTYYCVDRNNTCNPDSTNTLNRYTDPVIVITDITSAFPGGTYYIRYYSIDKNGNKEDTKSQKIRLFQKGESVGGGYLFIVSPKKDIKLTTKKIPVNIFISESKAGDKVSIGITGPKGPLDPISLDVPADGEIKTEATILEDGSYDMTITFGSTTQTVTNIVVNTTFIPIVPIQPVQTCSNNGAKCTSSSECCSGSCASRQCTSLIIQDGEIVPPATSTGGFIQGNCLAPPIVS